MGITSNLLPFPDLTPDPANIPADMEALAEALNGAPVLHSTGTTAAIGATPTLPVGLVPYVGLVVRNTNTADPAVSVEWVCVDTSPVTWIELSRTGAWLTWTPDYTYNAGAMTPTNVAGRYKRAGNLVTIEYVWRPQTTVSGLVVTMIDLPFTVSNQTTANPSFLCSHNAIAYRCILLNNTTTAIFRELGSATPMPLNNGSDVSGSATYAVA